MYIVLLYICTYAIYIYYYIYIFIYIYMIYALKRSLSHGNQHKRFYDLEEPSLLAGSLSRRAVNSLLKNSTVDRLGEKNLVESSREPRSVAAAVKPWQVNV